MSHRFFCSEILCFSKAQINHKKEPSAVLNHSGTSSSDGQEDLLLPGKAGGEEAGPFKNLTDGTLSAIC